MAENSKIEWTDSSAAREIAAKLSAAQKRWLTDHARHEVLFNDGELRWCTFPPANTHRVLHQLGLVMAIGLLTPLGLAVRANLGARS